MKIIKYFIQALFIYIFFLIIKVIGLKNSRKLFSLIFNLIGPLVRKQALIYSNLKRLNSNFSDQDLKRISKKMWSNYGKTFVEYLYLKNFRLKNFHIPQVKIIGENILEEIIKKKKPVIFFSVIFQILE